MFFANRKTVAIRTRTPRNNRTRLRLLIVRPFWLGWEVHLAFSSNDRAVRHRGLKTGHTGWIGGVFPVIQSVTYGSCRPTLLL